MFFEWFIGNATCRYWKRGNILWTFVCILFFFCIFLNCSHVLIFIYLFCYYLYRDYFPSTFLSFPLPFIPFLFFFPTFLTSLSLLPFLSSVSYFWTAVCEYFRNTTHCHHNLLFNSSNAMTPDTFRAPLDVCPLPFHNPVMYCTNPLRVWRFISTKWVLEMFCFCMIKDIVKPPLPPCNGTIITIIITINIIINHYY